MKWEQQKILNDALTKSGLAQAAQDAMTGMLQSIKEIEAAIAEFDSQIELLSAVATAETVKELEQSLNALKSALPEMDLSEFTKFQDDINAAVQVSLKDEEQVKKMSEDILKQKGIMEPKEEDFQTILPEELETAFTQFVFSSNMSELRSQIVEQLNSSFNVYKKLVDGFQLPEGDSDLRNIILQSDYGKELENLKQMLDRSDAEIKGAINTIQQSPPPESFTKVAP